MGSADWPPTEVVTWDDVVVITYQFEHFSFEGDLTDNVANILEEPLYSTRGGCSGHRCLWLDRPDLDGAVA